MLVGGYNSRNNIEHMAAYVLCVQYTFENKKKAQFVPNKVLAIWFSLFYRTVVVVLYNYSTV